MECLVVSPEEKFNLKVKEIFIDTGQGGLRIYPNHTDIICSIKENSTITVKSVDNKEYSYRCKKGILKIHSNKALILFN